MHATNDPATTIVIENKPVVENKNDIHVNTIFNGDCTQLSGKMLIECMTCLDAERLKDNFKKLNPRAAAFFLRNLSDVEKIEFASYFSDDEWHEWHHKLPAEQQRIVPATKQEFLKQSNQSSLISSILPRSIGLISSELVYWLLRIIITR